MLLFSSFYTTKTIQPNDDGGVLFLESFFVDLASPVDEEARRNGAQRPMICPLVRVYVVTTLLPTLVTLGAHTTGRPIGEKIFKYVYKKIKLVYEEWFEIQTFRNCAGFGICSYGIKYATHSIEFASAKNLSPRIPNILFYL